MAWARWSCRISPSVRVVLAAAHAGFHDLQLPLGGGAAVADRLAREWNQSQNWGLTVLGAGSNSPCAGPAYVQLPYPNGATDLTGLSERQYARFCDTFGRAVTNYLTHSPNRPAAAVINDIAEGPDFKAVAGAGIPLATIFHVDVVDYFCRIYLRGYIRPEILTHWYDRLCRRGWERHVPWLLRLVFGKQRDAVMNSAALVVPSSGMASILHRCYPFLPEDRVQVLPWGCWQDDTTDAAIREAKEHLLSTIPNLQRPVLLTLSRISPEKGLDTLMDALHLREKAASPPVTLIVAGEAAYMRGHSFLRLVEQKASRLRQSRVYFTGYANAAAKQALLEMADAYVFPSRHESYGLTLCEALAAGLPAITTDHYSAADLLKPETGWIVPREDARALAYAINEACDSDILHRKRLALQERPPPAFTQAAAHLGEIVSRIAVATDSR